MLPFSNPVSTAFCSAGAGLVGRSSVGALELRAPTTDLTRKSKFFSLPGPIPSSRWCSNGSETIFPELPLVVVSEFPVTDAEWIPYHIRRTWNENRDLIRAQLAGRRVRLAAVILEPRIPHWRLRALGIRARAAPFPGVQRNGRALHAAAPQHSDNVAARSWRMKNLVRSQRQPESTTYRAMEWFRKPEKFRLSMLYRMAMARGRKLAHSRPVQPLVPIAETQRPRGISVVIPSRNGRDLLEQCLPGIQDADEIIVVDNGSDDGTAEYLGRSWPKVCDRAQPAAAGVRRGGESRHPARAILACVRAQ